MNTSINVIRSKKKKSHTQTEGEKKRGNLFSKFYKRRSEEEKRGKDKITKELQMRTERTEKGMERM